MKKHYFLFGSLLIEILLILSIATANATKEPLSYFFYAGVYGLLLSTLLPLAYIRRSQETLDALGMKRLCAREIIVILIFVIPSVAGQLIPLHMRGIAIRYDLLGVCVIPLILTTFFEEFLFRGFMQTRFDKAYGTVPSIILSGLAFSLYHLGYPGFRSIQDLLVLLLVGIGFALSFKLSGNNAVVSYIVNLPNAFVTYILKHDQFPVFAFTGTYTMIAVICIVFIIVMLRRFERFSRRV